jgi:tetratricopeptide (TPR) repeat protein
MARPRKNRKTSVDESPKFYWKRLAAAALIFGVTFIVYASGIDGGFILDDDLYLTQNKLIADADGLYSFWFTTRATDYYPVSNSTLWLEWRMWGLNPTGYHVTNVILHAVASFLVYYVLNQLRVPGALLAGVLFAVHPVNVESVEWIAQRKGLLALVFFLFSLLWYLRSQLKGPKASAQYWLSLVAFALGILSKSSVAMLPLMLLLLIWWKRHIVRRDWILLAPFLLFAIVLVLVNMQFQKQSMGDFVRTASLMQRLLAAGAVVWFYLYKAVLPFGLVFIYPQWNVDTANLLWWVPAIACVVVSLILWRLRQGWAKPLFVAWAFYLLALLPVMGFSDFGFMKYSLVADHYQYVAIVSVVAVVSAYWSFWQRGSPLSRTSAMLTATVVICILIAMSRQQVALYRDAITLYQATTERNPTCWIAHYNLGCILSERKELQQAVDRFEEALKYKSDYPEAHDNLGVALALQRRYPEAIEHYREAARLKPGLPRPHLNLGISLAYTGQLDEGISEFREAIRLEPSLAEAHFNLGGALALQNKKADAIASYNAAVRFKPDWPEPRIRLAKLLADVGKADLAASQLTELLALRPDDWHTHEQLGAILVAQAKLSEAVPHFVRVNQLQPAYAEGYLNLAKVYSAMGQSAVAIATARKGIQVAQSTSQSEAAKRIETWLATFQR